MYIQRDSYLQKLIDRQQNGLVKVICGLRRSGKSFLLFKIFHDYLKNQGVDDAHIITMALDEDVNEQYREPDVLSAYIRSRITDKKMYYILLDEIQFAIKKEELRNHDKPIKLYGLLNGLLHLGNVDVYVTGSNSKMLAKDVMTEFRGRGDSIEMHPLSFKEYFSHVGGDRIAAYDDYARYGGMPLVLSQRDDLEKAEYLSGLFDELFFKDILERYEIRLPDVLSELTDDLCSSIGSLTNVSKIVKTLASSRKLSVDDGTIAAYLEYLTESYLFKASRRYDVKGKKYFEYPMKYYCADLGLRNARLNFRQQDESHIQENIIYNELVARGFKVDVGVVPVYEKNEKGIAIEKKTEIDFVINRGMKRYYIQSALSMDDIDKERQELRPLLGVKDMFRKVVITKTTAKPWFDDMGVLRIGIYDFLLDDKSLDF
jgi:predicted AAA+ superfamily ATPase